MRSQVSLKSAVALHLAVLLVGCSDDKAPTSGDTGAPDMTLDAGTDQGGEVERNPLDEMDPVLGPVTATLQQVSESLELATARYEVAMPDRILDLADPLGTARLVRLAEAESTVPCDPAVVTHCAKPKGAREALNAFADNKTQLRMVLDAAFKAIDAWAHLALAKYALELINLFHQAEQAGALTIEAQTKAAWLQAAADLPRISMTRGDPSVLWTDWNAVLPASAAAPLLFKNIKEHDPVPYPAAGARNKAAALAGLVAAFVEKTWGDRDPFYFESLSEMQARCGEKQCEQEPVAPMPAAQSAGAQAVRALAHLRAMAAWTDGQSEIDAYLGALTTLVQTSAGTSPLPGKVWLEYQLGGQALLHQMEQRRIATAQHSSVGSKAVDILQSLKDSLVDPNATDYAPNVATRDGSDYDTGWWTNWGPSILLRTADAAAKHGVPAKSRRQLWVPVEALPLESMIPGFGFFDANLQAPETDLGSSSWPIAGPTKITWTVTTSWPIDHVDLRIFRTSDLVGVGANKAVPFRHFLEVPDENGDFPMATWFDPLEDSELIAAGPNKATYKTYVVKAVAVDQKGKHSTVSCLQLDFRYGTDPAVACEEGGPALCPMPMSMEPRAIMACELWHNYDQPDSIDDYLKPNTIEIRENTGSGGNTWTYYRPGTVVMRALSDSVTLFNYTSQPHHFKSVHTAPYAVDLTNPVITNLPIGNVAPLDFGVVAAGASKTIALPADSSQHYEWTLYDVLGDLQGYRRFKVWINLPPP